MLYFTTLDNLSQSSCCPLPKISNTKPCQVAPPEAPAGAADIGPGLTPRNMTDMRTFLNLADFTVEILPAVGPARFKGWAYLTSVELVSAASERPLLSGFYRMLRATMLLANEAGVFGEPLTQEI